jgi:hypothetical protein
MSARWFCAFFGISCAACGHSPAASSPTAVDIHGRVAEFATGQPVPGIGVTFGEFQLVTDQIGNYVIRVPTGDYELHVADEPIVATVLVRGTWTHGDFFTHGGDCGARYGNITDRLTGRPVVGAALAVGIVPVFSDSDGWYRLDGGCGSCGSCNTIFITASASGYETFTRTLGRGFRNVQRLDIALERAPR